MGIFGEFQLIAGKYWRKSDDIWLQRYKEKPCDSIVVAFCQCQLLSSTSSNIQCINTSIEMDLSCWRGWGGGSCYFHSKLCHEYLGISPMLVREKMAISFQQSSVNCDVWHIPVDYHRVNSRTPSLLRSCPLARRWLDVT